MNFLAATLVFVGVNVVPMDTERVLLGQTVVIEDAHVVLRGRWIAYARRRAVRP